MPVELSLLTNGVVVSGVATKMFDCVVLLSDGSLFSGMEKPTHMLVLTWPVNFCLTEDMVAERMQTKLLSF